MNKPKKEQTKSKFVADIKFKFFFEIAIDKQTLNMLWTCAKSHYSSDCRETINVGGLLYKWNNQLIMEMPCTATFRELDLTLKVIENGLQNELKERYFNFIHSVLKEANTMDLDPGISIHEQE